MHQNLVTTILCEQSSDRFERTFYIPRLSRSNFGGVRHAHVPNLDSRLKRAGMTPQRRLSSYSS